MPSLLCPECEKELLPREMVQKGDHLLCPKCGRQVYERKKTGIKLLCPKCAGEAESDSFLIVQSE